MADKQTITEEVQDFIARTGMKQTTLGLRALNDPHSVKNLLKGKRRMWPETEDKLRRFMAEHEARAA